MVMTNDAEAAEFYMTAPEEKRKATMRLEEFTRHFTAEADALEARIEDLKAKLAKAEWLLVDATVQLEEGKIKTRRNRAALIRQFLAELTGGKDE